MHANIMKLIVGALTQATSWAKLIEMYDTYMCVCHVKKQLDEMLGKHEMLYGNSK